eukprot:CAMPEP_0198289138 /NCGR_PEP_ID=MMETSP1449-20131203/7435_1 /TAXON_ID=420275 /ORGANISM="Attheya septentrionalis, Strain CCMP2084" /LENGTH=928 /DNA_ID=CAMNT_0043987427 /DNA_START=1796 /DNA_END=4582 /DNA_ORIENTATION=+
MDPLRSTDWRQQCLDDNVGESSSDDQVIWRREGGSASTGPLPTSLTDDSDDTEDDEVALETALIGTPSTTASTAPSSGDEGDHHDDTNDNFSLGIEPLTLNGSDRNPLNSKRPDESVARSDYIGRQASIWRSSNAVGSIPAQSQEHGRAWETQYPGMVQSPLPQLDTLHSEGTRSMAWDGQKHMHSPAPNVVNPSAIAAKMTSTEGPGNIQHVDRVSIPLPRVKINSGFQQCHEAWVSEEQHVYVPHQQQQQQHQHHFQTQQNVISRSKEASPISSPALSPRMIPQQPTHMRDTGQWGNQVAPRFQGSAQMKFSQPSLQDPSRAYEDFPPEHHTIAAAAQFEQSQQNQLRNNAQGYIPSRPPQHTGQQRSGYVPSAYNPAHSGVPQPRIAYSSVASSPSQGHRVQGVQNQPRHSPMHQQHRPMNVSQTTSNTGSSSRSAPEVLKTLLRKKACLYETETSQAVALVTWLVGRELALEFGYFSRQQLQSGVHACLASKIEAGNITRTKVNRCMQIILNSCFHYIIPRPDGKEEKGDSFRELFALRAEDDSQLVQRLAPPWDDLLVDKSTILHAAIERNDFDESAESPSKSASRKSGVMSPKSAPQKASTKNNDSDSNIEPGPDSKRAVLLCFNENVKNAADVFHCHNEFIRDAANAANLRLSAQEWKSFFGEDLLLAASGPGHEKARVHLAGMDHSEASGHMSIAELYEFRTSWCSKRYDHDAKLCGFAHADVNNGWLRRDPSEHAYSATLCPNVSLVSAGKNNTNASYLVNCCSKGLQCEFSHSQEELEYLEVAYKTRLCPSLSTRSGLCGLKEVCPHMHPSRNGSSHKSGQLRSAPFVGTSKSGRPATTGRGPTPGGLPQNPVGSPMIYIAPAPESQFDRYLMLPGLQSLFRRNNSAIYISCLGATQNDSHYSLFGDDFQNSKYEKST